MVKDHDHEFLLDGLSLDSLYFFCKLIIYNYNKIVQLAVSCPHSSLPNLSFLNFTVSGKCIYTIILVVKFASCCHTNGC